MGRHVMCDGGLETAIKRVVRDVPDFPKPGILFKDITPLLQDPELFRRILCLLTERYSARQVDLVVAIESRGFVFGAPLAHALGVGFVPIRKKGKLPYDTVEVSYDLEYGTATIEVHRDAIAPNQRVVIVDDVLATGGTAAATCHLVERQHGRVVECAFVIELAFLKGLNKLTAYDVCTLARYE